MSKAMPPIPPKNQRAKGAQDKPKAETGPDPQADERTRNLDQQGSQGNIKQNTTNQGNQQDR